MPCDPNTLLEQAKCLNACIPQGMQQAVGLALLCNIADAGGGGGGGEFVLKTGDTMTGFLQITVPAGGLAFGANNATNSASIEYNNYAFNLTDEAGNALVTFNGVGPEIGFFGNFSTRQVSAANLTNNVTAGGVNDTIADFTSLTVYATDAAAIRNDIYQLARKLKQINDGLRAYGLFT